MVSLRSWVCRRSWRSWAEQGCIIIIFFIFPFCSLNKIVQGCTIIIFFIFPLLFTKQNCARLHSQSQNELTVNRAFLETSIQRLSISNQVVLVVAFTITVTFLEKRCWLIFNEMFALLLILITKWKFFFQKTAFSLVKSRLALGSPSCLVVWLCVCHHAENGPIHRKMVVDCTLAITSIGNTFFQTRPGKRNNWSGQSFA